MTPYDLAYEYAMHTNECIFLTGKAGTGKTTFLRKLRMECPKQILVCAPTGIAAINAEGVTIHSLFQLPPQLFSPTEQSREHLFSEMRLTDQKLRLLRNLELLVIDEVSMVRSDLLDTIDAVLRHVRHRRNHPFGGVQVLFIGDLYQLSPVAREEEWMQIQAFYTGPYFFQAIVFKELKPIYIELDKVFRQTNEDFIAILNQVRTNTLTPESLQRLNSRYKPDYRDKNHILLSTHNRKVDAINERELAEIDAPAFHFLAEVKDVFPESLYPMDAELVLKQGARVMFIKNDSSMDKAYYNGKLGTVVELTEDKICVMCPGDKQAIEVHREIWENVRYVVDSQLTDEVRTEVVGTFSHFPLRLAWAITIHKAQGLTFDNVIIDAKDAFASGQVYVALSRCRSLEGITLLSPIPSSALTNAREVLQFSASQPAVEDVEIQLSQAELSYFTSMLCGVYDFRDIAHQLEHLRRNVAKGSFNQPQTDDFIRSLLSVVQDWQRVAESFQRQIRSILIEQKPDYEFLTKRLADAFLYFSTRIQDLLTQVLASPALSDDKSDAHDYQSLIEQIYVDLSRQLYLMRGIRQKPSIRRFFDLRKSFVVPSIAISASLDNKKLTESDSQHPQLLIALRKLRSRVGKEMDLKLFQLAPTAALVAISNQLPVNKSQLMRIKGFGPKMYGLWGEQIIACVKQYLGVAEQTSMPLPSAISEPSSKQQKTGQTHLTSQSITPQMIEQTRSAKKRFIASMGTLKYILRGMSFASIAEERNLSLDVIMDDVLYLMGEDLVHYDKLSPSDQELVRKYQNK